MNFLESVDETDPEVQYIVAAADKDAPPAPSPEEIFDTYYQNISLFSHDYRYRLETPVDRDSGEFPNSSTGQTFLS